jgi:hypothetical protein
MISQLIKSLYASLSNIPISLIIIRGLLSSRLKRPMGIPKPKKQRPKQPMDESFLLMRYKHTNTHGRQSKINLIAFHLDLYNLISGISV